MNTNQDLISIHHKIENLKEQINQLKGKKQMLLDDIKKDNPSFDQDQLHLEQQQVEQKINTNLKVLNTKLCLLYTSPSPRD